MKMLTHSGFIPTVKVVENQGIVFFKDS